MTLRKEDIARIAEQVAPAVKELLAQEAQPPRSELRPELWERIVVIEDELRTHGPILQSNGEKLQLLTEELKAQRKLMAVRFDAMARRFTALNWGMVLA
jgi:pyruvate kinase